MHKYSLALQSTTLSRIPLNTRQGRCREIHNIFQQNLEYPKNQKKINIKDWRKASLNKWIDFRFIVWLNRSTLFMLKPSKSYVKSINQAFLTCDISLLLHQQQTKRQRSLIYNSRNWRIRSMELDQMLKQWGLSLFLKGKLK